MADAYYKHASAIVDDGSQIGEGSKVWHFAHVCGGAKLGKKVVLGQNVYVAPTAVLGDNVKVQNNVSIYDGVIIEANAFVGPSAVFTNVINPRSEIERKSEYKKTLVKEGATIGANATIVCGHTLGRYAFIAAGAVVTSDVPDYALMMGVPARQAGWMCRCGIAIEGSGKCKTCGRAYTVSGKTLVEG